MWDGTGKLPTLDSHVDNGYDIETMVYNKKRNEKRKKEGGEQKRIREVEERQQ